MKTAEKPEEDQDPDYAIPGPSETIHQKYFEEAARENAAKKISEIIEKEFSSEIDAKEKEILLIQDRLQQALKTLHFLRYVIITDYYNNKQCLNNPPNESKQIRIHPAVKEHLGKAPKNNDTFDKLDFLPIPSTSTQNDNYNSTTDLKLNNANINYNDNDNDNGYKSKKRKLDSGLEESQVNGNNRDKKDEQSSNFCPPRGARDKVRKRIIVGNISKWIPPEWRENGDNVTHKWTVYIRGSKKQDDDEEDISKFISKVRFLLHESYHPPIVDVVTPPFHLSKRGYGEFQLRVQLHFKNPANKPVDIYHFLKLDKTYTGLQTLGSETVVDIWLKTSLTDNFNKKLKNLSNDTSLTTISDNTNQYKSSHVLMEHDYIDFNKLIPEKENNFTIVHDPIDKEKLSKNKNSIKTEIKTDVLNILQPLKISIPSVNESFKSVNQTSRPFKQFVLLNNKVPLKFVNINEQKFKKNNNNSLLKKNNININFDQSKCLLLNNDSNIPALQIVEPVQNSVEDKSILKKGNKRDKVLIKVNHTKEIHDNNIKLIKNVKLIDIESLIRLIVKRIPLINKKSSQVEFRKIHPYCCIDEKEFLEFPIGKQRAYEWSRAKTIKLLVQGNNHLKEQLWTTKEIMIWCRIHGHTPIPFSIPSLSAKTTAVNCVTTCTKPLDLFEWKSSVENTCKITSFKYHLDDDEIDVVNVDTKTNEAIKVKHKQIQLPLKQSFLLNLPRKILPLYTFISDTTRQIGIKIQPEEIVPSVTYCASGQVIATALECFLEDLLRSALAKAWERSKNGSCPDVIKLEDVVGAILNRTEFNIFTNSGLGSQYFNED